MIVNKNGELMKVERTSRPWQIIQGDGETWILLRKKISVKEGFNKVRGIVNKGLTCDKLLSGCNKELYQGMISFEILCDCKLGVETTVDDYSSVDEEELEYNKSLIEEDYPKLPMVFERKEDSETEFFNMAVKGDLLQDNDNIKQQGDSIACYVEVPWRAWLFGEGEVTNPQIACVNIAQIGIRTLLLETVIVLNIAVNKEPEYNDKMCKALPLNDEYIFFLPEQVEEILDVTVQRGLQKTYFDEVEKGMFLENQKIIYVLYLCEQKGGERIKIGSYEANEKIKLTSKLNLDIAPVKCRIYKDDKEILKMDKKRVVYKCQEILILDNHIPEEKIPEKQGVFEVEEVKQTPVVTLTRKKPCERWMKKELIKNKKNAGNMTTLKMKLV